MPSTPPWFYTSEIPEVGATLTLNPREAKHAIGSRRLSEGDVLTLFDGLGIVATAHIKQVDLARQAELEIIDRVAHERTQPTLWLAASLPKGDRQSAMLNMMTQLGVSRYTALECEHSVALPTGPFWRRSERILREACKQAQQPHLPVIKSPREPGRFAADAVKEGWTVLLADPDGKKPASVKLKGNLFAAMVGPEGGFTKDELDEAVEGGAHPVTLGPGILRIETACVAMMAYLRMATL